MVGQPQVGAWVKSAFAPTGMPVQLKELACTGDRLVDACPQALFSHSVLNGKHTGLELLALCLVGLLVSVWR